jgi:hypothetical protein
MPAGEAAGWLFARLAGYLSSRVQTVCNRLAHYRICQDLQAFHAQQTFGKKKFFNRVSTNRETWNTLDSQDKAAWDTVSPAFKAKILNGTLSREMKNEHSPASLYLQPTASRS